jgi:hypothetical protein
MLLQLQLIQIYLLLLSRRGRHPPYYASSVGESADLLRGWKQAQTDMIEVGGRSTKDSLGLQQLQGDILPGE